jgi:hypothetical protein
LHRRVGQASDDLDPLADVKILKRTNCSSALGTQGHAASRRSFFFHFRGKLKAFLPHFLLLVITQTFSTTIETNITSNNHK